MRRIRFAKVRITGPRPPGAGVVSPLERNGATRGGSVAGLSAEDRMAMEHDRFVDSYPPALIAAAYADLQGKPVSTLGLDRKRDGAEIMARVWTRHRRAALLRKANGMKHRP